MERKIVIFVLTVLLATYVIWGIVKSNRNEHQPAETITKETKISDINWQDDDLIMKPGDFENKEEVRPLYEDWSK